MIAKALLFMVLIGFLGGLLWLALWDWIKKEERKEDDDKTGG